MDFYYSDGFDELMSRMDFSFNLSAERRKDYLMKPQPEKKMDYFLLLRH